MGEEYIMCNKNTENYVQSVELLLELYGYRFKLTNIKILNYISEGCNTLTSFLEALEIDYVILNEIINKPCIIVEGNQVYIAIKEKETIKKIDSKSDVKKINKSLLDIQVIYIEDINDLHMKILNSKFYVRHRWDIFLKNKLTILGFIFSKVLMMLFIGTGLFLIRTIFDEMILYRNNYFILQILEIIAIIVFFYFITNNINNKIVERIEKRLECENLLFTSQLEINYKRMIYKFLDIFSLVGVLPLMLILQNYFLNEQLAYYTITSFCSFVMFTILLYIFNKTLEKKDKPFINEIQKVIFLMLNNIALIILVLGYVFLCFCMKINDILNIGGIIMAVGIYIYVMQIGYNSFEWCTDNENLLMSLDIRLFEEHINQRHREKVNQYFNFDVCVNKFYVNNRKVSGRFVLYKNTCNLILGKTGTGKTLFVNTLLGEGKENLSRIFFSDIKISSLKRGEFKRIIQVLDSNILLKNDEIVSTIDSKRDTYFVYRELGIIDLLNRDRKYLTHTEFMLLYVAGMILSNSYILIFDNVLSRLETELVSTILEVCKELNLLVVVLEQREIGEIDWDQIIRFSIES